MKKFNDLIFDQFTYGGKKYAKDDTRESTDVLVDRYSVLWLLGTMDKYCFRYKNLQRERDILKIATYAFILWLKRGFWIREEGLVEILDTTVKVKSEQFPFFISKIAKYIEKAKYINYPSDLIAQISTILWKLTTTNDEESTSLWKLGYMRDIWFNLTANKLYEIYYLCYLKWKECYEDLETHDTDTDGKK